jgi:hypothetical protein
LLYYFFNNIAKIDSASRFYSQGVEPMRLLLNALLELMPPEDPPLVELIPPEVDPP